MDARTTITTTCTRDCPNTCGLIATVDQGRVTGLSGSPDHPLTQGMACHKTIGYLQRVYSAERIVHPLIRKGDSWHQVSWDTALDLIAAKMQEIHRQDGPEAVLYYQGYGERTALKLLNKYFFQLFGGVTTLRGSLCGGTGQAAQNLDLGHRISHDPLDHYNSRAMILWARNPVTTNISLVPIIKEVKRRGGRILVIDPVRNRTATLADHHLAPAPGMDAYLAMAAAKILVQRGAEDREFLAQHSVGGAKYLALLASFSLERLCEKAGVSESEVAIIAETLMTFRPTSILLGWGLHRHKDAHYAIRAIDALSALSGNIGVAGGGVSQGFEEYGPYDQQYWGDQLHPQARTLLMPRIGEELQQASDPRIRMAFITAANPVCMAPHSEKVAAAFKQMELVVYSGHFLNDTADVADVFLPATTFLEENDVMASYGHNYVGPVNQVIEPRGECRTDYQLFAALAERFPFGPSFCRGAEAWLEDICAPIRQYGCSLEQLRQGPFRLPEPMAPYVDKQFPTPSGKFQFLEIFDPHVFPEQDPAYPYCLLTVASHAFLCSERTLADHPPLSEIRLHPEEAAVCKVQDGEVVRVESAVGSMQARLRTDPTLRRDCVVMERGGWIKAGHGVNRLTADLCSTVGQGTPYYETRVTVSPGR